MRGPAYLVAGGGVLVILRLPFVGAVGTLLGMGLILVGAFALRGRASDPTVRRRLAQAGALAVVVTLLTVVLELLSVLSLEGWVATSGEPGPTWGSVVTVLRTGLGILGTGLLTAAMARESTVRGWTAAADAWWSATIALVVLHGPILAATVIVVLVGRPGGVHGVLGLALFAVAATPYALMLRAGARSGPALPSVPHGRGGVRVDDVTR